MQFDGVNGAGCEVPRIFPQQTCSLCSSLPNFAKTVGAQVQSSEGPDCNFLSMK